MRELRTLELERTDLTKLTVRLASGDTPETFDCTSAGQAGSLSHCRVYGGQSESAGEDPSVPSFPASHSATTETP